MGHGFRTFPLKRRIGGTKMEPWIAVADGTGAEAFLERTRGLHDGLLREVIARSRGFVTRDRKMFGDSFPMDVLLRFETQQGDASVVEILVEDMLELRLVDLAVDPLVRFEGPAVVIEFDQPAFGPPSVIRGTRMKYRVRGIDGLRELGPLVRPEEDGEPLSERPDVGFSGR